MSKSTGLKKLLLALVVTVAVSATVGCGDGSAVTGSTTHRATEDLTIKPAALFRAPGGGVVHFAFSSGIPALGLTGSTTFKSALGIASFEIKNATDSVIGLMTFDTTAAAGICTLTVTGASTLAAFPLGGVQVFNPCKVSFLTDTKVVNTALDLTGTFTFGAVTATVVFPLSELDHPSSVSNDSADVKIGLTTLLDANVSVTVGRVHVEEIPVSGGN
jgi:hypothetical protein